MRSIHHDQRGLSNAGTKWWKQMPGWWTTTVLKASDNANADDAAWREVRWLVSVLLCLASFLSSIGPAQASPPQTAALTLYQGQGVDADLVHILPDLLSGDLRFEDTYFTGLGYYHPLSTPGTLQKVFDALHVPGTGTGLELIVVKHYGMQDNAEIDAAYSLRFAPLSLASFTVRFGLGFGLSYAFGTPSYEDGTVEEPDKRYRFQSYGAYELEWGHKAVQRVSLVTRIHHRSGVYGVIAPPHVGSNFLTLGLRYGF